MIFVGKAASELIRNPVAVEVNRATRNVGRALGSSLLLSLRNLRLADAELGILRVQGANNHLQAGGQTGGDHGSEVAARNIEQRNTETEGDRNRRSDECASRLKEHLVDARVGRDP